MKRASNKPKRSKYAEDAEYERDLKRWKGLQAQQYNNTDPSKLSHQLLRVILSEHGILQAGCRELQEWRLRKFRKGEPVRQGGDIRPDLTPPERMQIEIRGPVLGLPTDLWRHLILPRVEDPSNLLYVSKAFYALTDAELHHRARRIIGHERATPLALVFLKYAKRCMFDYERANLLKLPDRVVRRKRCLELIRVAIERHGYIDHLKRFPERLERKKQTEQEEEAYILEQMPVRLATVNQRLKEAGYSFTLSQPWEEMLKRTNDWHHVMELRCYVHMDDTRNLETIIGSFKRPIIYETLESFNLDAVIDRVAFSHLLGLVSHSDCFYGRTLTDYEIVSYTMSIYQLIRYQGSHRHPHKCCVWGLTTVKIGNLTEDTVLVHPTTNALMNVRDDNYWWLNHTMATDF